MTLIADPAKNGLVTALQYVWDPVLLDYVVATQAGGGGGGGGGAVTVANGADVAQGATTDAESASGNGSVVALLKRIRKSIYDTAQIDPGPSGHVIMWRRSPNNDMVDASQANPFPITAPAGISISGGIIQAYPTDTANNLVDPATKQQLPAALGANGGLKVEGIAGGVPQPVSLAAAVDVSDRAGRALGVVASVTAPVDVSDRAGRALGVVASITAAVDVSDRAGRALGAVSIADAGDVTQGAKADAVWDGVTVSTTISAVLKYVGQKIEAVRALLAGTLRSAKREIGYANLAMYAEAVAGIIAETAITINLSRAFAAPAASTSNGAAVGKELVLTGVLISWVSTSTTANTARVRIRVNPAGAAIITSPIAFTIRISWESATFIANEGELQPIFFPEPIVIPNPGAFMATIACVAANGTLDIQLMGYERTP